MTTVKTLSIDQLKPGMLITGINRFSSEYALLDSQTIAALKEEFANARVDIRRKTQTLTLGVDELIPFDELVQISDIPEQWPLRELNPQTIDTLKKRGFESFRVIGTQSHDPTLETQDAMGDNTPGATGMQNGEAPETHEAPLVATPQAAQSVDPQRLDNTRRFLDSIQQAQKTRENSARQVEELMDTGRIGRLSTRGVVEAVNEIVLNESSKALKAVTGLKSSDQTYTHCVDVAAILVDTYTEIKARGNEKLSAQEERYLLTAGFLHDIGKSRVPKEILDSTAFFAPDSKEMKMMRSHVLHSAKILDKLGLDKTTINLAHYHHVKVDPNHPKSYPAATYDQVHPITRMGAIIDVYQALIGKRSYKKSWAPARALDYLHGLSGEEFDPSSINTFMSIMGRYPVGSLVRLSSNDLAFVVGEAHDVLERPVVAVVENAQGEPLAHHTLIDLLQDFDLEIIEVVDHFQHYADSDDQAYQVFSNISV